MLYRLQNKQFIFRSENQILFSLLRSIAIMSYFKVQFNMIHNFIGGNVGVG